MIFFLNYLFQFQAYNFYVGVNTCDDMED
jgi:hypothetical protein